MSTAATHAVPQGRYELRFRSVYEPGRGYSFRCDPSGHVDIDRLSVTERSHYFYARTLIGRDFLLPAVQLSDS